MADTATHPEGPVWTPGQMMRVRGIGDVRVSPDGRRTAFTVTTAVMEDEKSEEVSQIHLTSGEGEAHPITFHEKSSRDPQWSPDGHWLAFISNRNEKDNLYRLRLDGGEPEPITAVKGGVRGFAWSPDGQWLAYTALDAPTEEEEQGIKQKDDARWVDESLKMVRLWLAPASADANDQRTPRALTGPDFSVGGFDWSPDGREIAFSHTRTAKADDWLSADLSAVDVASGAVRPLVATRAAETQPRYSPDGRWIAFVASEDPPRWGLHETVRLVPAAGGPSRTLGDIYDNIPHLLGWSADGRRLLFTEAQGTLRRIYALDVESEALAEVNPGPALCTSIGLDRTGTWLGFALEGLDRPPEAHISRVDEFRPQCLSRVNAHLPPMVGHTGLIRWKSADGMEIEGLLTYPEGYQPGQRVPLLLHIHGGPMGVFVQAYPGHSSPYPVAAFAQRGFAVLRPNPRGSSGYGRRFRFLNYNDWGGGDYQDLMAGVDHVVQMGVADPERLGVMGWSYGGFMTAWVITHTHRFKAASVGAGVTHLASFTGTADIPSFLPDYFGGQPWEQMATYHARSPVLQVQDVTTPTLILHGEADERVPIGQGYELYNALKAQGVPVRMLVLPRQGHWLGEPKMRLKAMQANLDWFDKHLRGNDPSADKA